MLIRKHDKMVFVIKQLENQYFARDLGIYDMHVSILVSSFMIAANKEHFIMRYIMLLYKFCSLGTFACY